MHFTVYLGIPEWFAAAVAFFKHALILFSETREQ